MRLSRRIQSFEVVEVDDEFVITIVGFIVNVARREALEARRG